MLDTNEYVFGLQVPPRPPSDELLNLIVGHWPHLSIRIPRTIVAEVCRNLTKAQVRRFYTFINTVAQVDEDHVVPFEMAERYQRMNLKGADAFIAAYTEWVGASYLITENRHFLARKKGLPFKVSTAKGFLAIFSS